MPAPCLTDRNGVFCRAPGRRPDLRLPHISPKNGLFPLRRAAAQSMCAAEGVRPYPSRPHTLTPRRAAFPHDFPSANTPACILSPRSPAARSPRHSIFAPPGLRFPRASRSRNSFPRPSPSLPSLSFALRRVLPRSSPRRPAPTATRPRSLHSRIALSLFLLAPSFTRPAKQAASRLSDSASGFPAARRRPSSGVST